MRLCFNNETVSLYHNDRSGLLLYYIYINFCCRIKLNYVMHAVQHKLYITVYEWRTSKIEGPPFVHVPVIQRSAKSRAHCKFCEDIACEMCVSHNA